jgi:release factor glutamine methyltransferase
MPIDTIKSLLLKSTAFLNEKGIGEAKRSAELLLAHVLRCNRIDLFLRFDQPLSEEELELYRECIRRRLKQEPLQYIVGATEFYGLNFSVSPAVLIPRPETEHLVDTVLQLEFTGDVPEPLRILDIGTGSGIIAIILAAKLPEAQITATDISQAALDLALLNAQQNGVAERIHFIRHDILNDDPALLGVFDIIVSNPPYIAQSELAELQPEILQYEPLTAASDGADGLTFYRRFAAISGILMTGQGTMIVEIGFGQAEAVTALFRDAGLRNPEVTKDYSGINRIVCTRK